MSSRSSKASYPDLVSKTTKAATNHTYAQLVYFLKQQWAGEMAQWLRALAALPEDPGSILNTRMAALNCV